ncbi:YjiH family protein [Aminithiophilus ramosus]|nr:YjiH family protein [Aminithiophilus ramosus]
MSSNKDTSPTVGSGVALARFLGLSLFGLFMFFFPLTLGGNSTIPVDHIITAIRNSLPGASALYAIAVMVAGAAAPFLRKTWNRSTTDLVFSFAKVAGAVIGPMIYFKIGPAWLLDPGVGPFLFSKLAIPVGLVIPIGSLFLAFLVGFGLLEFTGVLMTPVMRPVFRTPGRSAIDAVASFVGSYSVGLIITNNVYRQGKYSAREAAIIATGFSTVSATFMLIVAKTLGLMEEWGTFFWVSMAVTFAVTAVTTRLWPLASMADSYYTGRAPEEETTQGSLFARAWKEGLDTAAGAPSVASLMASNLKEGLNMAMAVIPSITSIGLLGLLAANHTPIFDILGYAFYPFFKLFSMPEALLAGKAAAVSLAEMFLPAILVAKADAPMVLRFTMAVLCISEILFFSAIIPCIVGTDIPIKMGDILVIWFERVVLTILIASPIAMLLY